MTNKNNTPVTLATLKLAQVRALRDEAGAAGDARMVELCDVYLGDVDATDAEVVGAGMQICDAINAAAVQS